MPSNRNLNRSLAHKAFRKARALRAEALYDDFVSEAFLEIMMDDIGVPLNSPLRDQIIQRSWEFPRNSTLRRAADDQSL